MNEERVHVADAEIARRHTLPGCAAITADTKTRGGFRPAIRRWRGTVNLSGIIGWNQYPVRVGIDVVDRRPGLATVRAAQEPADFHCYMNDVRIGRMERDAFRRGLMRRAGKGPFLHARDFAQSRQLRPTLAEIIAEIEMRRLCTGVNSRAPIHQLAT